MRHPGVAARVLKENGMDKERIDIEVREYCGMSDVVRNGAFAGRDFAENWRNFYWQQQRKPGKCS